MGVISEESIHLTTINYIRKTGFYSIVAAFEKLYLNLKRQFLNHF